MPSTATLVAPPGRATQRQPRRGLVLGIILAVQLMVVLDATIVNIALPDIARALHFSPANLSWVITAYTLAFGGFLLLGARAGDLLGRRACSSLGIALFTAASFLGGIAPWSGWLLAARALQGVGGALAAPSALALLMTMFRDGQERVRAIGWYTAVSIGGGAIGLILGGLLVQWASWRWVLFVNVPIGIIVIALSRRLLTETPSRNGHFDVRGALTSTLGVTSLAYAFVRAATSGWGDAADPGCLRRGRHAAGDVRPARAPRSGADHAAAAVRRPQPERLLRRAALPRPRACSACSSSSRSSSRTCCTTARSRPVSPSCRSPSRSSRCRSSARAASCSGSAPSR